MFDMLIVEDDDFKLRSLKEFILSYAKDIEIDISNNLKTTINLINKKQYSLILIDMAIPSHPTVPGEGSPHSLLNGGIKVILELDFLERKDDCIIITLYPDIEISGQFFPTKTANLKIKELLDCNVLACIEYSEESDNWKKELKYYLEKYENFNFRR